MNWSHELKPIFVVGQTQIFQLVNFFLKASPVSTEKTVNIPELAIFTSNGLILLIDNFFHFKSSVMFWTWWSMCLLNNHHIKRH